MVSRMEETPGDKVEKLKPAPKAMLFDLDDTLAESFQPPSDSMIEKLSRLLDRMPVAIMTAAGLPRIEADFLHRIQSSQLDRLYIFPNSSAQCFTYQDGALKNVYDMLLKPEQRDEIKSAIAESVLEVKLELDPRYQPLIIDRDVQIAYAALGLEATEEAKKAWDPDKSKRKQLKEALDRRLPNYEVLIGGKTTIDITTKGITKAYGVNWLSKKLELPTAEMTYVGDAFYEGGNDAVVLTTGIQTRTVSSPAETEKIIDEVLAL